MNVWILMGSSDYTGSESIIGVYSSESSAKYALAEYVLGKKSGTYDYIELFSRQINMGIGVAEVENEER